LIGICGASDMRQIHQMIVDGDTKAKLAHDMFCRRIGKYIGAYQALLGSVDAVIFTGGIGENDTITRKEIEKYIRFDTETVVIPTDEELVIAKDCARIVSQSYAQNKRKID